MVIASMFVACAPKTLPPELKPAYTANEFLIRVAELQKTTIGLYDATPRAITKEKADLIVKFTIATADAVQQSLSGWQASVKSSWTSLKKEYTPTDPTLQTIWAVVDAMIQALQENR